MEPKIRNLSIERFRAFRQLKIEGLGRVNLITGQNNTGKSSILEALRILASDALPSVITSILRFREEDFGEREEIARPLDVESIFPWSSLFHGFPKFSAKIEPIVIVVNEGQRLMEVSLGTALCSWERIPDGPRRLVLRQQEDLFGEEETLPALTITVGGIQRFMPLDPFRRYPPYRSRLSPFELSDKPNLPCKFVSAYGGEQTAELAPLWDTIALTDFEKDIVAALRIIEPGISAVSMVGGEERRAPRTAIVRSKGFPYPVPLRSFGDGMNRLFGIVLSLVNAQGGVLLIDEFENGMHYSVQTDAWRIIFQLASRLDIQVVATSHSWDAIEAFQKAASETEEEGVLVRLTRKGEDIIPTLFRKEELAIVTRDRIEVR